MNLWQWLEKVDRQATANCRVLLKTRNVDASLPLLFFLKFLSTVLVVAALYFLGVTSVYTLDVGLDYFFGDVGSFFVVLVHFIKIASEDLLFVLPFLGLAGVFLDARYSVILAGLFFSFLHLVNPGATIFLPVALLPSSIIGAYIMQRYGLISAVVAHVFYDTALAVLGVMTT